MPTTNKAVKYQPARIAGLAVNTVRSLLLLGLPLCSSRHCCDNVGMSAFHKRAASSRYALSDARGREPSGAWHRTTLLSGLFLLKKAEDLAYEPGPPVRILFAPED
jgi:hypothetical protein